MLLATSVVLVSVFGVMSQSPPTAPPTQCSPYMNCTACVAQHLCGWCSEPVVYPGNITGPQCAGFQPNGKLPFACNGVYSTDQCVQGYVCNKMNFTCQLGPPGTGNTLAQCEAGCYNKGQVYLCNHTTTQCYKVPPGTPGASSYANCMNQCSHPSPNPSPTTSPSPVALWACNTTTGQCVPSTPGHGTSKQVCEQNCQQGQNSTYLCNTFLQQCYKLPPGTPGGYSLQECEAQCNPKPNPGPPPVFMGGIWRGNQIQNNYVVGEWDMLFTTTNATIVSVEQNITILGVPYNVQSADTLELWIAVTSGPGAGKTIKAIGTQYNRGPETSYLTAAFGQPGGIAPASITSAMTDGTSSVFALSQCVTPQCVFTLPPTLRKVARAEMMKAARAKKHRHSHSSVAHLAAKRTAESLTTPQPSFNDPCEAYGQSCQVCLQHEYCGWCSTDVIYSGGVKGTQCAGFNPAPNATNPFVCNGRYSTLSCTTGYDCNNSTYQCVADPTPGNGMPLNECEQLCHPTESPIPTPPQYVCNITAKTCYLCEQVHCPGSMPQQTCEQACVKPQPGPSALVAGLWRGIEINNQYTLGEFAYVFNNSGVVAYLNDKEIWSGSVESFGGDMMQVAVTTGTNSGQTLSAEYTIADQSGLYSVMTIGFGTPNGPVPSDYVQPMETTGMSEQVLVKCNTEPCSFHNP